MFRLPKRNRRQLNQFAHTVGFCACRLPTSRSDPVVPSTFVVEMWIRPFVRLLDQPEFQHPVDSAVQHTGTDVQLPPGPLCYFALQSVAMTFTLAKREQDMKHDSRKRQLIWN